jgi:sec-independent protein translocase protein TatA
MNRSKDMIDASTQLAFLQGVGGMELLVVFLVVLLFFGAKRLPELARGLGKSMKEFKKATQDVQDDFREAMDSVDPNKPEPTPPPRQTVSKTPEKAQTS